MWRLLAMLLLAAPAGGRTLFVDQSLNGTGLADGSALNPYRGINQAIHAALDGDTIIVLPGMYQENVNFQGKAVTLRSGNPDDAEIVRRTVISGGGIDSAVAFFADEGPASVLSGFTVTAGNAPQGGGIFCTGAPRIAKCIITDNIADIGGGVYGADNARPAFISCTISHNQGGGVSLAGGQLFQCLIINNALDLARGTGTLSTLVESSTIYANATAPVAGALVQGGDIRDSIIWDKREGQPENPPRLALAPIPGCVGLDPLFANPDLGDFHLKSTVGRWDPLDHKWVRDSVQSPCIDAGDPLADYGNELWPHGRLINAGAFGNTPEASMSEATIGNVADLNNNGSVDSGDLARFAEHWLVARDLQAEDLNRDGVVNLADWAIFAREWLGQE